MILYSVINNFTDLFLLHNRILEVTWTTLSALILFIISILLIKILYLRDDIHSINFTIKATGHQCYWRYNYSDFNNIRFHSFIPSFLPIATKRLLKIDNRCISTLSYNIRIITTSMNINHSWIVPSLGIKIDSTRGRGVKPSQIIHIPVRLIFSPMLWNLWY